MSARQSGKDLLQGSIVDLPNQTGQIQTWCWRGLGRRRRLLVLRLLMRRLLILGLMRVLRLLVLGLGLLMLLRSTIGLSIIALRSSLRGRLLLSRAFSPLNDISSYVRLQVIVAVKSNIRTATGSIKHLDPNFAETLRTVV